MLAFAYGIINSRILSPLIEGILSIRPRLLDFQYL